MNNREIKFRVWSNKNKQWIHGPGKEVNLFGEMILLGGFMNSIKLEELDDCIALEFTGLKDKTGREIYEGDLVNFLLPGFAHERYPENYINEQVWYNDDDATFFFGMKAKFQAYELRNIEVVGNIFENKNE